MDPEKYQRLDGTMISILCKTVWGDIAVIVFIYGAIAILLLFCV